MTDDLVPQLIVYYGPAVVFMAIVIWAVLHLGKKLENLTSLSHQANSSNLRMIELLKELGTVLKDRTK